LQQKDLVDFSRPKQKLKIKFKDHILPDDAVLIDKDDPSHNVFIDYLKGRSIHSDDYPFMVTPNDQGRMANRIIIPYTFKNQIVGHTSRFLDNRIPKYLNEQQPGYVFGYDFQKPDWQVCILVEGIFDAISINGCALMHNEISDTQAQILASLNRRIILVPDRDMTGLELCNKALELGYSVSIPNWEDNIKDVNDAVVKYGKLPTLLSILSSATTSKIKVELYRKKIEKRLRSEKTN
jgi:DNA primase